MTKASVRRAVAISVAIWGTAAQAQVAAPPEATASSGDALQEIIVTAQRRAQNIEDVPVSIQFVSNQALEAAGIKSTQDLGQITPNVTIISPIGQGNQPLITIRGIGLNDFDTNNAGPNGVYRRCLHQCAVSAIIRPIRSARNPDLEGSARDTVRTQYERRRAGVHIQPPHR
jgi:outer membrane receptor protein involved in Fe transport